MELLLDGRKVEGHKIRQKQQRVQTRNLA